MDLIRNKQSFLAVEGQKDQVNKIQNIKILMAK